MAKEYHDKIITLHPGSFLAYFFYVSASNELHVVTKKGWQYKYTITDEVMDELMTFRSRGSYIANYILKGDKYPCEFVRTVSPDEIRKTIYSLSNDTQ